MTLEDRLTSWGHWSRKTGRTRQSTGSLEGDYRSPQRWDAPIPPDSGSVNVDDCRAIELAWATLGDQDKVFLRGVYCKRYGKKRVLFLAGGVVGQYLDYRDWPDLYQKSHTAINAALNRGEERNHSILRDLGRAVLGMDPMRWAIG